MIGLSFKTLSSGRRVKLPAVSMHAYCFLFSLLLCISDVNSDSWLPPQTTGVASPGGEFLVRIEPGDSVGDVFGFAGEKKGKFAQAFFYHLEDVNKLSLQQKIDLVNPIAPVFYVVTNQGKLVTFDNWHNVGYGKVLVIYAASGKLIKSFSLSDMYSKSEREKIPASVSSLWWRCSGNPQYNPFNNKISFNDAVGNIIEVDIENASVNRVGKHKGCDTNG